MKCLDEKPLYRHILQYTCPEVVGGSFRLIKERFLQIRKADRPGFIDGKWSATKET